jgi:adenylate cyclase
LTVFALTAGRARAQTHEELDQQIVEVNTLLDRAASEDNTADQVILAEQALKIARDLRYEGGILRASLLLGPVHDRAGRTQKALEHYLEAEDKLRFSVNRAQWAAVNRAIGDLFFREKLYANARRYYDQVLRLEPGNLAVIEKAGDAAVYDARLDSATVYYQSLINTYQERNDFGRVVQILRKLADANERAELFQASLDYYLQIEEIIERHGTPDERSVLYNNLGRQYARMFNYEKAVEYFRKAELQCVYTPCEYMDVLYANLGIALHNTGHSDEGITYLKRALNQLTERKDRVAQANLEHLMATVYFNNRNIYNALTHNNTAIRLAQETKQPDVLANAYKTAADLYLDLYDFEQALKYFRQYLTLQDSLREIDRQQLQESGQQQTLLAAAENQIKYLLARQSYKEMELEKTRYDKENLELVNKNLELEVRRSEDQALLLQKQQEVDQAQLREQQLSALSLRQQLRLAAQNLDVEKQGRIIASLRQQELVQQADSAARGQDLERLRFQNDMSELKLKGQESFRRLAYIVGLLGLVILGLAGGGYLLAQRNNQRLAEKNRRIQAQSELIAEERHKSDQLLLNILPEEIATELKTRGYASPRFYDSATVLFTDFTNFTTLSAELTPEQLIDELNACFLAFDEISDKYNLEKIKTIGDAYMCAGGVPVPNDTHALDAVGAALEMAAWLERRRIEDANATFFDMRIGIHTGPVVAGVVGKNKFAYDIWGDAVNLAARLEELGEPGRVNISGATYEAVRHRYRCTFRGKKEVRNKGLVEMYFIEGPA